MVTGEVPLTPLLGGCGTTIKVLSRYKEYGWGSCSVPITQINRHLKQPAVVLKRLFDLIGLFLWLAFCIAICVAISVAITTAISVAVAAEARLAVLLRFVRRFLLV